jgi:hypothetical protein
VHYIAISTHPVFFETHFTSAWSRNFIDSGVCEINAHVVDTALRVPPCPLSKVEQKLPHLSASVCEINAHSKQAGRGRNCFNIVLGVGGRLKHRADWLDMGVYFTDTGILVFRHFLKKCAENGIPERA